MSQISEIPVSAYTPEMETLRALPDIPTFDGEPVLVSPNPLTSGTRPLQLLSLPGTEFPVRYETSRMRGFQAEVDLGKARSGGSSTDAFAFWDLLDPPMRARVVAAGFGDYAAGLRRTPFSSRYEIRVDGANKGDLVVLACLRDLSQVGAFDWATLALAHLYHGLDVWTRGSGESNWLFIRPLEVWSYEYRIYPGGPSGDTPAESRRIPRYLAHCHHTYASGEDPEYWRSFLNDRELSDLFLTPWDCEAWRTYPGREVAEFRDAARLPEILEYTQEQKTHKTAAHYRAEAAVEAGAAVAPARPTGIILGDVPFPPGMELDPEHATHLPAQRYLEVCQRFSFAQSYIAQLYSERHERALEIGRLRRHQSRQSSAVSRLQAEVDRLRTRLEVEGIPLDSSDKDDDGSSGDAPPSPPPSGGCWSDP
ncbi:hypothetical protein JCGZ_13586 [Jatropha curcas]|uniref:Aminotransferase-like plant mobile domain-containing protein n=1 Tax=Jatropha curcas TaxID=180498 RepID=A0A067KAC1_JATCU|nr:hypothetical protein JCGZ_13586 [Jatropha curcas]